VQGFFYCSLNVSRNLVLKSPSRNLSFCMSCR
jgi:hypothetical protein